MCRLEGNYKIKCWFKTKRYNMLKIDLMLCIDQIQYNVDIELIFDYILIVIVNIIIKYYIILS